MPPASENAQNEDGMMERRARSLAIQAYGFLKTVPRMAKERSEVAAWLEAHGGSAEESASPH